MVISRTPDPHKRPYWDPNTSSTARGKEKQDQLNLEFNVSHQAGLVGLAGAVLPPGSSPPLTVLTDRGLSAPDPQGPSAVANPSPLSVPDSATSISTTESSSLRIGIDITCTNEPGRSQEMSSRAELHEWVSIFTDVFSSAEIDHMKYSPLSPAPPPGMSQQDEVKMGLRRFYTFFALKEAYVKMTGEALLANWLKEVEFRNVHIPPVVEKDDQWASTIDTDTQVWFKKRRLTAVKTEIRAWGPGFIVATAVDSTTFTPGHGEWKFLNWKEDIEACALGKCKCLTNLALD